MPKVPPKLTDETAEKITVRVAKGTKAKINKVSEYGYSIWIRSLIEQKLKEK